jgi:hypothetical protein
MRLGIAGPGGASAFGDVYITDGISVPRDNQWHSITFDVLASDFKAVGSGTNITAALANVTQFRILNNTAESFIGGFVPNEFYLDNIRAIGAPAELAGDYNDNGTVDAADYVVWRDMQDQSVPPGSGADGTGPGGAPDGVVNTLDYDFWRARFGNVGPGGAAIPAAFVVPEPASCLLMLGLSLAIGIFARPFSREA